MDVDSDGRDEVLVTNSTGALTVYAVNLSATPIMEEVDYLGKFSASASTTNNRDLILYNGEFIQLNVSEFVEGNAELKMSLIDAYPLAIHLNVSPKGRGNITLDLQVGTWSNQQNFTASTNRNMILYPETNGTLWMNFTFLGYNSSWDREYRKFHSRAF